MCFGLAELFAAVNLVMVYLACIVAIAFACLWPRTFDSGDLALGVAAFDFFFVPPYLTFAVADAQYVFTFAVMLVVGLVVSELTARVRAQAEATGNGMPHGGPVFPQPGTHGFADECGLFVPAAAADHRRRSGRGRLDPHQSWRWLFPEC